MAKLFQIYEDDLAALERLLPAIVARNECNLTTADKVAVRQVQAVLTNVRWNYGPHQQHFRVDGEADVDRSGGAAGGR